MPGTRSVLLCGATGLVGRECLELLAADPSFHRVVVITRRPLPPDMAAPLRRARLEQHVIDFDTLEAHANLLRVDQIICALGTTMKQAGSKERFRQVDFEYPAAIARIGSEQGVGHMLLVTAIGANARSRIFYNRVKGELEDAVSALPYRSITIVRPSLLLGERSEFRVGEEIGKRLSFLIPGRYRPVASAAVAAALVQAAKEDRPGRRIIESVDIPAIARRYGLPAA
jgi:uncharacterized protein YbjT (DUF2867 family)